MNLEKLSAIYNEGRNGANGFIRHPLVHSFTVSNGVEECADCGIWWLIDIAATEIPAVLRKEKENLGVFKADVYGSVAKLSCDGSGDRRLWRRTVDWTDMPEGTWTFYIADEASHFVMILPSEY